MATRIPFPHEEAEFGNDDRISFSKLDNKFILEDDDGSEWGFDANIGKWVPVVDEALLQQQQQAYAVEGVDEEETAEAALKKRKQADRDAEEVPVKERQNTAIYVTSLPEDVTVEEVHTTFSKFGLIAEEIETGKPRIKLYEDESGKPKGDALIIYFRPESVNLAIQMLDDSDFRLGEKGPSGPMTVKAADFSYKKQKDAPKQTNMREKKKIIKRMQKLNNKLADWDDDDPSAQPEVSSRWDKVVILKHMFTLEELEGEPTAILDIKEDIREEGGKVGEVTNVVLFDKEPEGVASVRFTTPQAANACVKLFDGRMFGGKKVVAYISQGNDRFKKTNEKKAMEEGSDSEDEKRLGKFEEWLEKGGEDEAAQQLGGGEETR
ncbi:putative nuclear mRNA splicing factor-associated protein [Tothia fuscella]|uniref:Nuclear mRNA splicing factor-associated protein n=1 Tax=Tothia fuscella TaxID=1048955 RepID=A0A9P4NSQ6_9PEZI|nr:putative nuclear mRNA splicing factor-associated protein [Tothia fuscella]